ncbi:MAG: TolC family protein, partial [Deltaproteobacteria bacterium]|nr:TolC family protein [Deltaproteobacteria bacterium]
MSKKTITLTLLLFFLFLIFLQIATANESNFFTLERAIEMALSNNSLILAAKEKEKAAIEEEKSARKEFLPKAKASYSYTRLMDEPYSTASGYKIIMGEKDNFKWDITLTQPIFTGFALVTKHKMAKLGIDISRVEEEQAMMDVEKRVKIAYFNILLAKKFLFVADEAVSQLEAHVRDAEKFYKQGMIAYNDLLKSKVALSHAIQQRVKAKSELKMAISSFNTLLMLDINQKSEVQDLLKERSFNFSLDTLFTQAMANRPELKALRLALKNAGLAIKLAKSSYFPKIFLIGSYEQTGDNLTATNNDYGNDHNAGVTLLMQWTFFEWGKKRNEVEKYR